jgi:hypothetical protein
LIIAIAVAFGIWKYQAGLQRQERAPPPAPAPAIPAPEIAASAPVTHGSEEVPAATVAKAEPVPKVSPPEVAPTPPTSDQANLEVARKMVSEGRAAFKRKEYKASISYANSALLLDPSNAEARKLLKEAQAARQQAMKGISID